MDINSLSYEKFYKSLRLEYKVHLSFEHFDVVSKVDKSTDRGKLLSIC